MSKHQKLVVYCDTPDCAATEVEPIKGWTKELEEDFCPNCTSHKKFAESQKPKCPGCGSKDHKFEKDPERRGPTYDSRYCAECYRYF